MISSCWRSTGQAVLLAALAWTIASAQQALPAYIDRAADSAGVFAIWPGSGVPPGSENATWHEQSMQMGTAAAPNRMVRNVVIPTLTMYKPDSGTAGSAAMIVAPGGGFRFLMVDYEGIDLAHWLAHRGITAFVLKYRVAHSPDQDSEMLPFLQKFMRSLPKPDLKSSETPRLDAEGEAARKLADEDGRQAIRFVRRHAAEWSIDSKRIGIVGFSAGGGVVMGTVMQHGAESRPDFAAPIYAAYQNATPVPSDAPPLFIAIADDDQLIAPVTSARLYEAWHSAGKPAELHVFRKGGHGFGMKKQNLPSDAWIDMFQNWLEFGGYMKTGDTH